jgi:competence protein ComEC
MGNPFFWISLYFSLGIISASRVRIAFHVLWAIAAACCMLCACLMHKERAAPTVPAAPAMLALALFFCGAACLVNYGTQPLNHIRYLVPKAMTQECVVSGVVANDPETAGSRTTFYLEAKRLAARGYSFDCSGMVLAVLNGTMPLEYGSAVEMRGMLGFPSGFRGARRVSVRDFLHQKGIYAILRVRSPGRIRLMESRLQPGIVMRSLRMKRVLQDKIRGHLSPVAAGIMEAMLLGDKSGIPRSVYKDMIKSGTVHILVVSGFNVSIVAGILALALKVLRLNRMARLAVIAPALVFYCMMTGASPPVVRATIMGIFFFFSWYVRRDPGISQALSLSAFAILAINPGQLFDASFQLSFVAVLAICSLSPALERLAHVDKISIRPVRWVAGLGIVSFSAWLGTAGFIGYYFRIIAPVTVLANIFIPAIASFITLCGVGLVVVEFLCPYFAGSFASVSEALIVFLLWFNSLLIRIPGAYARFP